MQTIGLSPKVYVPALAQIVAGIVLILLGLDVEGKTAIGTGLATFGLGYSAPPAPVAFENEVPGGIEAEHKSKLG